MKKFAVDLLRPRRIRRWVMPLGLLGLVGLFAITRLAPEGQVGLMFAIGRVVFAGAYLALIGFGYRQTRRRAMVHVDESGLREGESLLAQRASFERVLASSRNARTTIEIRGKTPLALELPSGPDADALLAALDPGRARATLTFLATTTPLSLVVLAWMGIPVVLTVPVQALLLLKPQLPIRTMFAYAVPAVLVWLTTSWWFMRRRRVTVTPDELELPRLFSTDPQVISLAELATIALLDPFTVELRFASRRPRRFKIYDPALLAELVDRLKTRSRAQVLGVASPPSSR